MMATKNLNKRAMKHLERAEQKRKAKNMICVNCGAKNPKIKKVSGRYVFFCRSCGLNPETKEKAKADSTRLEEVTDKADISKLEKFRKFLGI